MFKSIFKAASAVVDIPVSVAADVVTMGGVLTDQEETYTGKAAGRLVKNVSDIANPDK